MKNTRSTGWFLSPLLVILGCVTFSNAYADDYSDVSQLLRSGKFPEALSKADQFLAGQPKDVQMRFLKGVVQRESGKTSDAIATFVRLTEDYPELPEPYNNLAVLYAGQGQYDRARTALEMAIRTNPSYSTAHENLGDVYAKLASQAYNKALQLDNNNSAVAPKLALIKELFSPIGTKTQRSSTLTPVAPVAPPPMIAAMTPGKTPTATAAPTTPPAPPTLPAMKQPTTATTSAPAGSSGSSASPQVATAAAPAAATAVPATTPPAAPVVTPNAASVVATAPAPPSAIANIGAPSNAVKDVESVVRAWAAAWSAKDVKTYLGLYGKEFDPSGSMSRAQWEDERRQRISSKSTISVRLENLTVNVNGSKATAKFKQDYKANGLAVSSRKVLELSKAGDRWRIVQESVAN